MVPRTAWCCMPTFPKHPLLSGIVLSALLAAYCPAEELRPGDSRVTVAAVALLILVPLSVITAYALRAALRLMQEIPRMRRAWLCLVLGMTFFIAGVSWSAWQNARRYHVEGRSVMGRIIETHPEDHDTIVVAYTVSETDFRVRTQGPRVARSYQPGDAIQVYHPASAPAEGVCREPRWRPGMVVVTWLLGAGLLPVWMAGLFSALRRRLLRKAPAS